MVVVVVVVVVIVVVGSSSCSNCCCCCCSKTAEVVVVVVAVVVVVVVNFVTVEEVVKVSMLWSGHGGMAGLCISLSAMQAAMTEAPPQEPRVHLVYQVQLRVLPPRVMVRRAVQEAAEDGVLFFLVGRQCVGGVWAPAATRGLNLGSRA